MSEDAARQAIIAVARKEVFAEKQAELEGMMRRCAKSIAVGVEDALFHLTRGKPDYADTDELYDIVIKHLQEAKRT